MTIVLIQIVKAFVAGWGATSSQCDSNSGGPNPFTMCKFPFVYKGESYTQCAHTPTPSTDNKICKEFFKWAATSEGAKLKIKSPSTMNLGEAYSVIFWDTEAKQARETTCYSHATGKDGWCGTCYQGELSPGDEGYCDKYFSKSETGTQQEMGKPKTDKNWGWCTPWCKNPGQQSLAQTLKETRLDILTENECQDLGSSLTANNTIELCSGKKTPWPEIKKFKRVLNKSTKKHYFTSFGVFKNYLGFDKQQKYDFYLGGTDSCQGDSGGPLYLWQEVGGKSRVYMIGVVSRGTGCANLNQPGIFTRIKAHLSWIKEMIKSGNCKK